MIVNCVIARGALKTLSIILSRKPNFLKSRRFYPQLTVSLFKAE